MATTNRQQMIENVRRFWIDGVLENSLHGALLLQLGLRTQPDQVHRPWDVKIRHDGQDRSLGADARILDVFDYAGGALLILGDPGSGKTTLLLELTRDLLDRAQTQPEHRVPVVLNLSSWAKDKPAFDEWLVDELNIKYQVARAVAETWVADQSLLLLLDGLDEVAEPVRDACVDAINIYHRQHPAVPLVVCSRTGDYDALTRKLDFHDAVMIEPLNEIQIDTYLASFGASMNGLRLQLTTDHRLRALAQTPLTLSIMTMAYQGVDAGTLPEDVSMDVQRRHLFETYIETMFERHSKSRDQQPSEVMSYLSWLAGRMVERQQTLFHIENLQWDWLETRWQQSLFKLLGRTAYGTVIGALAGGLAMIVAMLLMGVILGQDVQMYRGSAGWAYGVEALAFYGLFGVLFGILAGGIPFGLTGLIAFTGDRLRVKGQAKGYRTRTMLTGVVLSVACSVIGGLVLILLMVTMSGGDFTMYGRHFFEIGASDHYMEGIEAVAWWMQISMLMGLVGGVVSVIVARWWHQREGRARQIVNGVAGFLIGGSYTIALWIIFVARDLSELSDLFFPTLIIALFTGGIGILAGGFVDRIESAESIGWRWSWRWSKVGLAVTLVIIGLDYLSMILTWYSPPDDYLLRAITLFLPLATLFVLVGGVAGGLRKNEKVDSRTEPNHGVRRSARTALKITGAFAIVGIFIGLISMAALYGAQFIENGFDLGYMRPYEVERMVESFQAAVILGVSSGLVAGLILGGTDTVIKHLVLRLMLWRNGDIPLNLAHLLDHASSLILMRKVGGGYIFVHRYLLEHFATIEAE